MTNEEAIKELEQIPKHIGGDCDGYEKRAIRIAIEAIEKQIPKKPINQQLIVYGGGTKVIRGKCPECGQPVGAFASIKTRSDKKTRRDEDYFCSYCGQALDWSDTE